MICCNLLLVALQTALYTGDISADLLSTTDSNDMLQSTASSITNVIVYWRYHCINLLSTTSSIAICCNLLLVALQISLYTGVIITLTCYLLLIAL